MARRCTYQYPVSSKVLNRRTSRLLSRIGPGTGDIDTEWCKTHPIQKSSKRRGDKTLVTIGAASVCKVVASSDRNGDVSNNSSGTNIVENQRGQVTGGFCWTAANWIGNQRLKKISDKTSEAAQYHRSLTAFPLVFLAILYVFPAIQLKCLSCIFCHV